MAMHKFPTAHKKAVPRAKHVYNVPEAEDWLVRDEISRDVRFSPRKYHSHRAVRFSNALTR